MGWNDWLCESKSYLSHSSFTTTCGNCGAKLKIIEEEQEPGFKDDSSCSCPVCHTTVYETFGHDCEAELITK